MGSDSKRIFTWTALAAAGFFAGLTPQTLAQDQLWVTQYGSSGHETILNIVPDGVGGAIVGGHTDGDLGGSGAGRLDAFIARHDSDGNRLWLHQFGTTNNHESAAGLAADGQGGALIAGHTGGDLGGPNAGSGDVYVARYNSAGTRLWLRQFGTTSGDIAFALAPYGAGGATLAGGTWGSFGGANAGAEDVLLARLDGASNFIWTAQLGSSADDVASALINDTAGGVFVAGDTLGDLGGPNAGQWDVFLARYDSAGDLLWIRQIGTDVEDRANALAPDGAGGAIVAGVTRGNLGGQNAGSQDAFLARYDSAGNQIWIRQVGTTSTDWANGLEPDGTGGVWIAGATFGSLGGPNAGSWDVILAHYDSDGNELSIEQFGTIEADISYAVGTDGAGGVMIGGYTDGSLNGPNAGSGDVFLARYSDGTACPGDLNNDGVVDLADLGILLADFGCTPPGPCAGDLDGDGDTDLADLGILLADFGCSVP